MFKCICLLSMLDLVAFSFFSSGTLLGWDASFLSYQRLEKVRRKRCIERRREVGSEGVSEWVLVCLLCGADIIKDSPCVLPLLSSKGMLAPGSSASHCVALAEKRLRKWL